jgi:MSHA biogenesis protein MshO
MTRRPQHGFTLVEMIMVIVITGIIGGMVAMFLKAPIQQYMSVVRRADMTDIADTALRRVGRDLRLALPNSVRVTTGTCPVTAANPGGSGTCSFMEFLPSSGGGRYRVGAASSGASAGCGSLATDALDFTAADTCFEILGGMPPGFTYAAGDLVAIYNLGISGASAYKVNNTAAINVAGSTTSIIKLNSAMLFPFESPSARFDIINKPVSYVCDPNVGNTLTRYGGYSIQANQPKTVAQLALGGVASSALLAKNVSACSFSYDAFSVAQRSGLVTMNLGLTVSGETVTLYSATHVSNVP